MFEIEKNIPIPKSIHLGAVRLYPINDMEIGDSFFVVGSTRTEVDRIQSSIMGSVRNRRYPSKKFTTRQIKQAGKISGVRCWRIE